HFPHGLPKRIARGFGLLHQHVRRIGQLVAFLHQTLRRLARCLRPASYFCWEHRAAVEVRTDAVGQIPTAPRAQMRAIADRIEGEFGQVEAGRARDARDPMVPTIGEEERALLGAENPRTLAIEMGQPPLAEDNRIFRRDHPRALRARPLWLVHTWMRRRLTSAAGTSSGSSCCEPPRFKEPESYFRRYAGLSDEEAERRPALSGTGSTALT